MNDILLSIIIPAYNCEEYIAEGIDSVRKQMPDNCELILVDDGSSDATRKRLACYEHCGAHISIFYNEHKGTSGARNAGLDAANGKYITFMDCDDMLQDTFLDKSLPLLDKDADLYIFGIERFLHDGGREQWAVSDKIYADCHEFADEYIRKGKLMVYSNCNKFYKKSIIDTLQLRFIENIDFGEDRLFNYAYITACEHMIITSSIMQLKYLQRSLTSMSIKHIPSKDAYMKLHEAKVDCFTTLARNVTDTEKDEFIKRVYTSL